MKAVSEFTNIYLHREPVDMRKGINGLCEIVQLEDMGELDGRNLFVFCGKRKDSIKVLYFDRCGYCLWQKRLETDRFSWPKKFIDDIVVITSQQFEWLLEGYDVWKMRPFSELFFEKVS